MKPYTDLTHDGVVMLNFEEELKKFHPSLEIEEAEDAIYNQDMTDMADLLVDLVREDKQQAADGIIGQ